MRDPSGISRGSGFVAFSSSEEASRAVRFILYYVIGGSGNWLKFGGSDNE